MNKRTCDFPLQKLSQRHLISIFGPNKSSASPLGILYKDLVLLLAGAIIGVASGLMGSYMQAKTQQQNVLAEKRLGTLRELLELNNEAWRQLDSSLESVGFSVDEIASVFAKIARNNNGPGLKSKLHAAVAELRKASTEIRTQQRMYDAKMATLSTLLSVLTGRLAPRLELGPVLGDMQDEVNAAMAEITAMASNETSMRKISALSLEPMKTAREAINTARRAILGQREDTNAALRRVSGDLFIVEK